MVREGYTGRQYFTMAPWLLFHAVPCFLFPFDSKLVPIKTLHSCPALNIFPAHPGRHSLLCAWHCLPLSSFLSVSSPLNLSSPRLQAVLPLSFSAKQGAGHSVSSLAVPRGRKKSEAAIDSDATLLWPLWKAQGSHGLVPGKATHHKELHFQS